MTPRTPSRKDPSSDGITAASERGGKRRPAQAAIGTPEKPGSPTAAASNTAMIVEHADAEASAAKEPAKGSTKVKKKLKFAELDAEEVAKARSFIENPRNRFGRIGETEIFLIKHLYLSEIIGGDAYDTD